MNTNALLPAIATHVTELYNSCKRTYLYYHNLEHTRRVVKHADVIAAHYSLDEHSHFILMTAAWFHDTGQLSGDMAVHEETGVQFMKDFFYDKEVDEQTITTISECILATKMPVAPANLLEEIICDADTWHLGTSDFYRLDALVWIELELRLNIPIENQPEKSLQFLELHRFYTTCCIQLLSEGKKRNIELLKALLKS